jgi:hypothetical protein
LSTELHDYKLTSGVAATRFSNGYRSFGTPTVNFEYGIPRIAALLSSLLAFAENDLAANRIVEVDEGKKSCRIPDLPMALALLMVANRIMVTVSLKL